MNIKSHIKKVFASLLIVFAVQFALAASTSTSSNNSTKAKSKYSLQNLNRNIYKSAGSLSYSVRQNFHFSGSKTLSVQVQSNTVQYNSVLRFDKGNTTYIYPYKTKVHVPKFKTPTAPIH